MIFKNYKPSEHPLNNFIDQFIYYKDYTPEYSIERVVPDGHIYLIFELDDKPRYIYDNDTLKPQNEYRIGWVSGMQKKFITISAEQNSEMFVVRFKPGGAYPFLHIPVNSIDDKVIPAESVLGKEIINIRYQIKSMLSPGEKFEYCKKWLLGIYDNYKCPDPHVTAVTSKIINDSQFFQTSLKELIHDGPYSHKHFLELFKKSVGLTPKYFHRITRFNEILNAIHKKERIFFSRISMECGYFDQSHFIKEFKHFSGFNPKEFIEFGFKDKEKNFYPIK